MLIGKLIQMVDMVIEKPIQFIALNGSILVAKLKYQDKKVNSEAELYILDNLIKTALQELPPPTDYLT